jgi:hypothetical protein
MFWGVFVMGFNRLCSAVVMAVVALIVTMLAGYWNSRGVIPVGDMRVPSTMLAVALVGGSCVVGGVFGSGINWGGILAGIGSKAMPGKLSDLGAQNAADSGKPVTIESVAAIPVEVAHLLGCVHHLRVALAADEEGQELLDKVQIKVGRVTAKSVSE